MNTGCLTQDPPPAWRSQPSKSVLIRNKIAMVLPPSGRVERSERRAIPRSCLSAIPRSGQMQPVSNRPFNWPGIDLEYRMNESRVKPGSPWATKPSRRPRTLRVVHKTIASAKNPLRLLVGSANDLSARKHVRCSTGCVQFSIGCVQSVTGCVQSAI